MDNQPIPPNSEDLLTEPIKQPLQIQFNHFKALDGLRGIAVLVVMVYHLEHLAPELHSLVKGGFLGVDVFFVLSGFLITSILLKEYNNTHQISLKNFYLRRFFRLTPAYWLFLIVLYFFAYQILPASEAELVHSNNNFLSAFFYLTNWNRAMSPGGLTGNLNHTWSISIEEQFYILWSLVLYLAFKEKRSTTQLLYITLGSIAVVIVGRAIRAFIGVNIDILYYSTDTRIDALLIGCVASMVYIWRLIPKHYYNSFFFNTLAFSALLMALSILFNYSYKDISLYYFALPAFSLAVAIIILWLVTRETSLIHSILEIRLLRWVGKISYGLYLWHYAMYEFGLKSFPNDSTTQIVVGISLAFLIASFSFYLVEQPFLKLKNRFQTS